MELTHINEERLQALAEASAIPTSSERVHLQACETCQADLATYKVMYAVLPQELEPDLAPDFTQSVMARIPAMAPARQASSQKRSLKNWLWLPLGVAVSVAFFMGLFKYFPDIIPDATATPQWNTPEPAQLFSGLSEMIGGNGFLWISVAVVVIGFAVLDGILRRSGKTFTFF